MWPNTVGRCGLGGVKGHIKAFEKVKQGAAPCKIDAGGNTECKLNFHNLKSTYIIFYQISPMTPHNSTKYEPPSYKDRNFKTSLHHFI